MKQFIVAAAILPILMIFVLQFTKQEIHHSRFLRLEELVHNARMEASMEGEFTQDLRTRLIQGAAEIFQVEPEEVVLQIDEPARYQLSVPMKGIVAAGRFFGIADSENSARYTLRGEAPNLKAWVAPPPVDSTTTPAIVDTPSAITGTSPAISKSLPEQGATP
jgi:hypothetical protein